MNSRFIGPVLGRFTTALLTLSLAAGLWAAPSAFAKGGGGGGHGGGGAHGGGGHSGGHSGGHYGGGYHRGGYYGGYTHRYYPGGFYGGYSGFYFPSYYLSGYSGYAYPNYYYPNAYGYGYAYPSYTYPPDYVTTDPNAAVADPSVVQAGGIQGAMLGIDEEAVVDGGGPGMRVDRVYAGSAAERAGLQVGDVIRSANGYLTQVHGNLTWIINNQAPGGALNLVVHRASDGRDVIVPARLP
jgi:hypothetical protein